MSLWKPSISRERYSALKQNQEALIGALEAVLSLPGVRTGMQIHYPFTNVEVEIVLADARKLEGK